MDIGHTPVARNRPALDRIEVIDRAERPGEAADVDELLQARLQIAGLVGRAALQNGGLAVPEPREAEPRGADRQHRVLQRREIPAFAAVTRDFHARDPAAPAPGQPADLVEPRTG